MIGGHRVCTWAAMLGLAFGVLSAGCAFEPGTGQTVDGVPAGLGVASRAETSDSDDQENGNAEQEQFENEHESCVNDELEEGLDDDSAADGDDRHGDFEDEHQFGGDDDDIDEQEDEDEEDIEGTELKAALTDDVVSIVVEYEQEDGDISFEIEVVGGQPEATLDVSVNGVVVLAITLDSSGAGDFEFSNKPDDPDEQQLSSDFPVLAVGETIAVGELSGPLQIEQGD